MPCEGLAETLMNSSATERPASTRYAGAKYRVNGAPPWGGPPSVSSPWTPYPTTVKGCPPSSRSLDRPSAGANPYDRHLSDLIGELSTRSDEFRVRWAAYNMRFHRTGTKQIHHPVVGKLDLDFETMELSADGLSVAIFTAEPGSTSQQTLDLLASWTATPDSAEALPVPGGTGER